jgi:hypothetical protein
MKHVTCLLISFILVAGVGSAQPNLSVADVSKAEYTQWLSDKDALWTNELEQMRPFAPAQVEPLEQKLEEIRRHATRISEESNSAERERLKSETHLLVYSLERDLEGLYVDLERASGPIVVLRR